MNKIPKCFRNSRFLLEVLILLHLALYTSLITVFFFSSWAFSIFLLGFFLLLPTTVLIEIVSGYINDPKAEIVTMASVVAFLMLLSLWPVVPPIYLAIFLAFKFRNFLRYLVKVIYNWLK